MYSYKKKARGLRAQYLFANCLLAEVFFFSYLAVVMGSPAESCIEVLRTINLSTVLVLAKGQGRSDILATQLDSECTLQLSKNLLVRHCTASLVIVDLMHMQ